MQSHRRALVQSIRLTLFVSALVLVFAPSGQGQQSAQVSTTSRGGLRTVTFDTIEGKVIVNLPDDMMAGDTISGTVMVEPKGQTQPEIDKSTGDKSLLMELLFDSFKTVNVPTSGGPRETFTIKIPASAGNDKAAGQIKLALKGNDGEFAYTSYPLNRSYGSAGFWEYHVAATNETLGQPGRPVEISGHFDGSFENTKVTVGGQEVPILAESPRKAIFESPINVLGPAEIVIREGKVETKTTFRNIGVRLSAPRTNLLKGESTTLTVQVSGLEGIKQPVPLTLESRGVITMEGGTYQPLMIQPSEVGADGRYSTTRGITGVQPGGWGATVMVLTKRFNVCLQDDSVPGRVVMVNIFSGNYIFTPPGGTSLSGTGTITAKGCIFTLEHNAPDRRVMSTIDQCTNTGSASVMTVSPKANFTITDRSTTDNTCAVQ